MSQPRDQPDDGRDDPAGAPAPEGTLREALAQFRELQAYAAHYLAARIDAAKVGVRNAVLWAVLGCIALCAASAMLLTAAVLLVVGAAQGVAALCGGRAWAGNLIVGVVLVGGVLLGAWLGIRLIISNSRKRTVKRYERRLQQERVTLDGTDAAQRSREFVSGSH